MKATTCFLPTTEPIEAREGEDESYDQARPIDRPESTSSPEKWPPPQREVPMGTPVDHPAHALLDSMMNDAHRARQQEQEEWRESHRALITQAKSFAAALQAVINAEAHFMVPLTRIPRWYDPVAGRKHSLYHHVDQQLAQWKLAHTMVTQLEAVEGHIRVMSQAPAGSRNAVGELGLATIQMMVKNARGSDAALRDTCARARHLISQIQALPRA